jgi:hypothetical protein
MQETNNKMETTHSSMAETLLVIQPQVSWREAKRQRKKKKSKTNKSNQAKEMSFTTHKNH